MTKKETIQKIHDACVRVLKQVDYAGGVVLSLELVASRLAALAGEIKGVGEMTPDLSSRLYEELFECGSIIGSIYNGLPMVPAEDVASLKTGGEDVEMVEVQAVAQRAADELEKAAAGSREEALAVVTTLKSALAAWESAGDTDAADLKVPFVKAARIAKMVADRHQQVIAQKAAAAAEPAVTAPVENAPVDAAIARLDAIAKRDEAPAPAPDPTPVTWGLDLSQ